MTSRRAADHCTLAETAKPEPRAPDPHAAKLLADLLPVRGDIRATGKTFTLPYAALYTDQLGLLPA
jgi:hypothetical protein